jgi:hypothetical protein
MRERIFSRSIITWEQQNDKCGKDCILQTARLYLFLRVVNPYLALAEKMTMVNKEGRTTMY